jgi:hypothetical protein
MARNDSAPAACSSARCIAEIGCANEIAAISGHASLREVERYTRAADQARLALLLDKRGVLQLDELILALQQTAAAHRESGDPNNLADAIHAISEHLVESDIE